MRSLYLALLASLSIHSSWAQSAQGPAATPPDAAPVAESWTQHFDRLWPQRDNPKVLDEIYNLVKAQQAKDPNNFDVNWRLASLLVWQADGLADYFALFDQLYRKLSQALGAPRAPR